MSPDDPLGWVPAELDALADADLLRDLRHLTGGPQPWIELQEPPEPGAPPRLLHLCSNNYLGLATDRRVAEAAADAAIAHGAGSGASRLITGGQAAHRELEATLADWKGEEAALLFSSGYLANLGVLTVTAGPGDTIVSDELNHASIVDACRLSRAEVRIYRHGDAEHAERLLADAPGRRVLVTDGVFSMDGDLAPLPALCDAAERHGAAVVVDDAHGTGVVGPDGRGTVAALGCEGRVHAVVGTLSKALGSTGGFVVGRAPLIRLLTNRARPFIFDTALAAPAVAAAACALRLARQEPQRRTRAVAHARGLAAGVTAAGLAVAEPHACIVPVVVGSNRATLDAMAALARRGVLAVAIRPPSVPEGTARLRATVMATHTDADIALAIDAFTDAVTATAA
ncbi:MAG: 8-amino-7-oxononanoate synthase [Actinobacteria bacterium]|nr:8-amino-7-oxononanoate synthase [Actinomycetota bacterium]